MSHIYGHVDDPPWSNGKLSVGTKTNRDQQIEFVPPKVKVKRGNIIGFHPLLDSSHTVAYGYHTAKAALHEKAEKFVKKQLKLDDLLDIYHDKKKRAKLKKLIDSPQTPKDIWDILSMTLAYIETSDFKFFYFENGDGQGSPSEETATDRLLKFISGSLKWKEESKDEKY